jgi:hypothetical protein
MRRCTAVLFVLTALAGTEVHGQAVQLPTFSYSSVGTTVVVPDGGSTFLGGISRSSSGRNEFGTPILDKIPMFGRPFKNVGIGQANSASSFRVTATIHDFDAMDEALLGGPVSSFTSSSRPRPGEPPPAVVGRTLMPRNPSALAGNWQPKTSDNAARPTLNLADEQARRTVQQQTRGDEAEQFFARAQQAEADGKPNVAKIYYQMVTRRAGGDLKQQAVARLEAISGASNSAKFAQAAR